MELKIIYNIDKSLYLSIDNNIDISTLKEEISHKTGLQGSTLRLVHRGRVLRGDEQTLDNMGLLNGDTLHVTTEKKAKDSITSPSSSNPVSSAPKSSFDMMEGLASNPLIQSMLSNTDFMREIMTSDPRMKRIAENNPEIGNLLQDEGFLSQMSQIMKNPSMMKEMQRNTDLAMSNIENMPGGFEALRKLHKTLGDPDYSESFDAREDDRRNKEAAKRLNVADVSPNQLNEDPLPNPWASSSQPSSLNNSSQHSIGNFNMMDNLNPFSGFMMPSQSISPPQIPTGQLNQTRMQTNYQDVSLDEYESKYKLELEALQSMGFTDKNKCILALLASGGNLDAAIEYLLKPE